MSDMTFETSNASMVSGLVDYMSTLVSGDGTIDSDRRRSDNPPPLPPKVSNAKQPVQPVCSLWFESVLFFLARIDIQATIPQCLKCWTGNPEVAGLNPARYCISAVGEEGTG